MFLNAASVPLLELIGSPITNATSGSDGGAVYATTIATGGNVSLVMSPLTSITAGGNAAVWLNSRGHVALVDSPSAGVAVWGTGGGAVLNSLNNGGAQQGSFTCTRSPATRVVSGSGRILGAGVFAVDGAASVSVDGCSASSAPVAATGAAFTLTNVYGNVRIANTPISSVNTTGDGGAIAVTAASGGLVSLTVTGCPLTNLTSGGRGAAIAVSAPAWQVGNVTITVSPVSAASATGDGGAVFVSGMNAGGTFTLQDSGISHITAGGGSTVWLRTLGRTVISNSPFSSIVANGPSGGAAVYSVVSGVQGSVTCINSPVTNISTTQPAMQLGAFAFAGAASASFAACPVTRVPTARYGGGMYLSDVRGNVTLRSSDISHTAAIMDGGALFVNASGNASCIAAGCNATAAGVVAVVIDSSAMTNVSARTGSGGAVFIANATTVAIVRSPVVSASAAGHGGAWCIDGGWQTQTVQLTSSAASGTSAGAGSGGALCVTSVNGSTTIQSSDVTAARAGLAGGAWFLDAPGAVTVASCNMRSIAAGTHGGVAFIRNAAAVSITGCAVDSATASTGSGAGFFVRDVANTASLTNCSMVNLAAGAAGGGLFMLRTGAITMTRVSMTSVATAGSALFVSDVQDAAAPGGRGAVCITQLNVSGVTTPTTGAIDGGIINLTDVGNITVSQATLASGTRARFGGALFVARGGIVTLSSLTVANVSAVNGGGAFALVDVSGVSITTATLTNVSAGGNGTVLTTNCKTGVASCSITAANVFMTRMGRLDAMAYGGLFSIRQAASVSLTALHVPDQIDRSFPGPIAVTGGFAFIGATSGAVTLAGVSTATNISVGGAGGAVAIEGGASASINDLACVSVSSGMDGSCLSVRRVPSVFVEGVSVTGASAAGSGAVAVAHDAPPATMRVSILRSNITGSVAQAAAGVSLVIGAPGSIARTTVDTTITVGNLSVNASSSTGDGCGLSLWYQPSDGTLDLAVENATLSNLAASRGAGVFVNVAGAVNALLTGSLRALAFSRCVAQTDGGGLYFTLASSALTLPKVTLQDVSFVDCVAGRRGGAGYAFTHLLWAQRVSAVLVSCCHLVGCAACDQCPALCHVHSAGTRPEMSGCLRWRICTHQQRAGDAASAASRLHCQLRRWHLRVRLPATRHCGDVHSHGSPASQLRVVGAAKPCCSRQQHGARDDWSRVRQQHCCSWPGW